MEDSVIEWVKQRILGGDKYPHGCGFDDCLHTEAAKAIGTYKEDEAKWCLHFRLTEAEI